MRGIVLNKWVQSTSIIPGLLVNTPACSAYSITSQTNYPMSTNVIWVLCEVEADEDVFQAMSLDKDIIVIWYESAAWNTETSVLAPEYEPTFKQYGIDLGLPIEWIDAHFVIGRLVKDILRELIEYLEGR